MEVRGVKLLYDVLTPFVPEEGKRRLLSLKLSHEAKLWSEKNGFPYASRVRWVVHAIRDKGFVDKLHTREIWDTTSVGVAEVDPDGPWMETLRRLEHEDASRQEYKRRRDEGRESGYLRCGKCKSFKTDFYEVQTRSADEPMTVFITCHDCGARTKR